jgi:hypothetical protein
VGVYVPKSARLLFTIVIASLATLLASADQAQHSPQSGSPSAGTHRASPGPSRFAQAAEITSSKGFDAKLPPHIATLLRIASEQECPVKQSVTRSGSLIQGLDVSVANKNDVVIFVVDETAKDQTLYLTSPDSALRRVVKVSSGVGSEIRITDKERKSFQQERQYWMDHLVPATHK